MDGRIRAMLFAFALCATCMASGQLSPVAAADTSAGQHSHCIFDQMALRSAAHTCRPHAIAYPTSIRTQVQRAIYDSSLTFGVPYDVLVRIATCESGLNPRARNVGHYGLFQFAPATFRSGVQRMKHETGIRARSFWSARDSSYVAGYLFATGGSTGWVCR